MATKITYTQQGDYLLPDLKLPEQPKVEIGIWGKRHLRYIKQHHPIRYTNLLTSCKLTSRRAEQQLTYTPRPIDLSEFKTRRLYIDAMLEDAGWIKDKDWLDEVKLHGMPAESGVGYADYVLYGDDGRPLAVIEAKRACKDPAVGRQQAALYANILKEKYGRRPVIFLTNGFDTRIEDNVYPERLALLRFTSLQRLLAQSVENSY